MNPLPASTRDPVLVPRLRARHVACVLAALALLALLAPAADAARAKKRSVRVHRSVAASRPVPMANAAPAPAPEDSSRLAWTEARGLADEGRHAEALAVIRRGLRRDPDSVDLRWLEAAVTGWAGRHAEAVLLYERLLADRPDLARDVRADLARERLDAGDVAGALRDLDLRAAEDPTDRDARMSRALALSWADRLPESLAAYDSLLREKPDDGSVMLERGRVLGWMGRNHEAAAAYRAVLEADPANRRARLGLAMNENWQGLHRRAAAQLDALANEPDADPEALKALAFARYWSGEPDRARVALDRYLALKPEDREARDLDTRLRREARPSLTLGYTRSDDTDALRVGSTSLELRLPLPERVTATLGVQRDNVRDNAGTRDPLLLSAGLERVWSAAVTTNARVARVEFGGNAGGAGLVELGLVVRPEDRLRVDLGVSNDLVVTRLSLARGITARAWVAGADWNATERLTLRASERQRFYSDDNRSQNEAASAVWKLFARRQGSVSGLVGVEQLRTRRDLDNGYYDPAQYLEWGPGLEAEWGPREDVQFSGAARYGWQRERGAGTDPYFNLSGRAEWRLRHAITLSLEGGRSNSNLSSSSGYERRFWAVSAGKGF